MIWGIHNKLALWYIYYIINLNIIHFLLYRIEYVNEDQFEVAEFGKAENLDAADVDVYKHRQTYGKYYVINYILLYIGGNNYWFSNRWWPGSGGKMQDVGL